MPRQLPDLQTWSCVHKSAAASSSHLHLVLEFRLCYGQECCDRIISGPGLWGTVCCETPEWQGKERKEYQGEKLSGNVAAVQINTEKYNQIKKGKEIHRVDGQRKERKGLKGDKQKEKIEQKVRRWILKTDTRMQKQNPEGKKRRPQQASKNTGRKNDKEGRIRG